MSQSLALCALFLLVRSLVGCGDSDNRSSASDGGPSSDGAHADAALATLLETDDLRVADRVWLVPSLAYCPTLRLLRVDGTQIDVAETDAQISVVSADEQVVTATEPGDCGNVPGVLALASGTTTARWVVRSGSVTLSATAAIEVRDGVVSLVGNGQSRGGVTIPVGESDVYVLPRQVSVTDDPYLSIQQGTLLARLFHDVRLEPAGVMSFEFDASASASGGGRVRLHALQEGETYLHGSYGFAGHEQPIENPEPLAAVAPGVPMSIVEVLFGDAQERLFFLEPGQCARAHLYVQYIANDHDYLRVVDDGFTLSVDGDGSVDATDPLAVCASQRGELTLEACIGSVCGRHSIVTSDPSELDSLEIMPSTLPISINAATRFGRQCSSLQIMLKYVDGDQRDVSRSPLWRVQADWPGDDDANFRFEFSTDEHGAPSVTDGKLCFIALGPDESRDIPLNFNYSAVAVPGTATLQYRVE